MLEGWLNDGAIRLVPIDRLGESLRQLAASDTMSGRHWPLRPSDWLAGCAGLDAPPRDSLAHDLVAALEHHRPLHRTRRWAAACGVSYKRLRAELDDALALRPAEVAQLFVLAQTEHADAAGIDRFSTARMLGFAGESELAHCLQRGRRVRQLLRKQAASTEEQSVEN